MRKILCAIDFSEASLNSLDFAVAIGERLNAELVLLNIFTPEDFDNIIDSETYDADYHSLLENTTNKMQGICDEINSRKGGLASCTYKVRSGSVLEVMEACVVQDKDDLVVIGTTGRSELGGQYIGSRALEILQHTKTTVMCVPATIRFNGIRKIVYATDYQEEDKIAIQPVIQMAEIMEASVEVLHIAHHESVIDKAIHEEYKSEMRDFVHYEPVLFNMLVYSNVSEGLDKHMQESRADLLVLLDRRRSFFQRLFRESLKKHLTQISAYPFMIVKL